MNRITYDPTKPVCFTIRQLLAMRNYYEQNPDGLLIIDLFGKTWNKQQFKQWVVNCLNNRLNAYATHPKRYFDSIYFWDCQCTKRLVNSRSVVRKHDIHPVMLRKRLAHRITIE